MNALQQHVCEGAAMQAVDPQTFKGLMRGVASSVTVVTTVHGGLPHGMTATAFSSVSADPPMVLIVLNKGTRTHPLVSASRVFVVNMLHQEQTALGARFAGKLDDQFAGVDYHAGRTGAPILADVVSYFECETVSETDVGTHTIFVGRVVAGQSSDKAPLLYHCGQYKSLPETAV